MPSRKSPLRVLLADVNASFAELVESTLDGHPGIDFVGWAVDGKQALELAMRHQPDIAFIGIDMPGGIGAAQQILRVVPKPPKIILVGAGDADGAILAGTAEVSAHSAGFAATSGFSGYMSRTDDAAEMIVLLTALTELTASPPDATNGNSN